MSDDSAAMRSRRGFLCAGAAVVAAGAVATATTARAQTKIEKSMVMYQETPKDGQHCSICLNFQPPNACALVGGDISPNGWCGAFAPKA